MYTVLKSHQCFFCDHFVKELVSCGELSTGTFCDSNHNCLFKVCSIAVTAKVGGIFSYVAFSNLYRFIVV